MPDNNILTIRAIPSSWMKELEGPDTSGEVTHTDILTPEKYKA